MGQEGVTDGQEKALSSRLVPDNDTNIRLQSHTIFINLVNVMDVHHHNIAAFPITTVFSASEATAVFVVSNASGTTGQ